MDSTTFLNSGVRLGRIKGIEIWVHWAILIVVLYRLHFFWVLPVPAWLSLSCGAIWVGCVLGTILLHELGHCWAAHLVGGGADRIVLWPLGGLARCDAPHAPRPQFWVSAGGPLVNVAIVAILFIASTIVSAAGGESLLSLHVGTELWRFTLASLFYINVVLLIFNLTPAYPLDGGQMLHALLWARTKSFGRAGLITVYVTRGALILLLVLSFFPPLEGYMGLMTVFILLWIFLQSERFRLQLHEIEADSPFGYDFSRGYTSLERTMHARPERPAKPRGPGFFERLRQRRAARERERIEKLRHEVDALLEKIATEGMASLTPRERRRLEEASRKLRGE